jgi:GntR family transcriptional regulator
MLDEKAPVALYYQLKEILFAKIKSNEWPINSKIPTERELCELFKVSRITVRQALSELEQEGYLYRKQGKGTFVTAPKIEQRLAHFYSFSEEIKEMGYSPSSKMLAFSIMKADENIAKNLGLNKGDLVYSIKRLRLANEEPFAIENSFVPYEVCPGLSPEEIVAKGLYNTMNTNYGLVPNEAIETFEAIAINADSAHYLDILKDSPGLLLERVTRANQTIVEYCQTTIRGDRYKYQILLK